MEKIIRWSCFTASACIVAAFLFALYISTLLPDTFHVGETGAGSYEQALLRLEYRVCSSHMSSAHAMHAAKAVRTCAAI